MRAIFRTPAISSLPALLSTSPATRHSWAFSVLAAGSLATAFAYQTDAVCDAAEVKADPFVDAGRVRDALPEYSLEEVSKHKTAETGLWVTFRDGVYDITDFVEGHPGGEKILMAAGGALEPFWSLYAVHKESSQAAEYLRGMRIGNISAEDRAARDARPAADPEDPFGAEPSRHPALTVNSARPFNAECPIALLPDNYITPNELFFVRNHLPVPDIEAKEYVLEVGGVDTPGLRLTLDDLKARFRKHTIVASLQCGGNRRSEMNAAKGVKGLGWGRAAISNAEWSGARLRDVLLAAGLPQSGHSVTHVQFEGTDVDESKMPYGASIPVGKAMAYDGDVILAYEMNGEPLPRDHGFPVRVVVPGHVGSRNVKWVKRVVTSTEESPSFWQQNDYKFLSPATGWDQAAQAMKDTPAIQELPVQSGILYPQNGEPVEGDDTVTVGGYAWSGGGRGIMRVEVSVDGGKSWQLAELEEPTYPKQDMYKSWGWTLWEAKVAVPKDASGTTVKSLEVCAKAVDIACNSQPENWDSIWNIRGLASNAWPRVTLPVVE